MRGKKVGQATIPVEDIQVIVELSREGISRYEIAKTVKHSTSTVYRYQKMFL